MDDRESGRADSVPTKSARKRESTALQQLGSALVDLSPGHLHGMDLPETLRAAVLEAQRIRSRGALRRQIQYIGRLMRDVDPAPLIEQLSALRAGSDHAKAELHEVERWRARLLADDDALTDWLNRYPVSDVQRLRQLIREARRESADGRPPRANRSLFRLLTAIRKDRG